MNDPLLRPSRPEADLSSIGAFDCKARTMERAVDVRQLLSSTNEDVPRIRIM